MTASIETYGFVNPMYDTSTKQVAFAKRIKDFNGLRMGLIDNRKHNVDKLLVGFEKSFRRRFDIADMFNLKKFIFSMPASETDIAMLVERTDFVVAAIAD